MSALAGRLPVRPAAITQPLARTIGVLAGLAAAAVALAPPATYLLAVSARLQDLLDVHVRIFGAEISEAARQNPALWNALAGSESRPAGADPPIYDITPNGGTTLPERRAVFNGAGGMIIESMSRAELAWPVLAKRIPLEFGETRIGEVEISVSSNRMWLTGGMVALASGLFGTLIFLVLRVAPLRLMEEAIERASFLSAHDALTGLPNRALFAHRLQQELGRVRRNNRNLAVLYIDLDRFKEVNDTLGHFAGDSLLCTVSQRILASLRRTDTAARLGGDEFGVILTDLIEIDDAKELATRLIGAISQPMEITGNNAQIGASVGIAIVNADQEWDVSQAMQNADIALYQVKAKGRGAYCVFEPQMNVRLRERRAMEIDLRAAAGTGALFLHYQPQVDLCSRRIVGAEALLRWNRPGCNMVSPATFIPLAEEIGLIGAIGENVLRQACKEAATWPEDIIIAVNVSPIQLLQPAFHEIVLAALRDSGLTPSRLELEVTEGVLLKYSGETLITLRRMQQAGVLLAMDDFGTGYSSLSCLRKFHFDKIKLDRMFITGIDHDPECLAIVRAVIGLSVPLHTHILAEGVETENQAAMLRAEGCEQAQGYLFGRPMGSADFRRMLAAEAQAADFLTMETA